MRNISCPTRSKMDQILLKSPSPLGYTRNNGVACSPAASPMAWDDRCGLQWTDGRRFFSEPGALVDSGRSSLTSFGSQESLVSEGSDVFSDDDLYDIEEEEEEEIFNKSFGKSAYRLSHTGTLNTFSLCVDLARHKDAWKEWTVPANDIVQHNTIATNSKTCSETIKT